MNINVATDGLKTGTAAPFEVERLGARLGAEIHGLDLKKGLDAETHKALEAALIEHKVIVIRDQHLDTEQHVEMSRWFGELEVHPMRPQGEFPEILVLDNHKDNPVLSTDVWHSDTTFRQDADQVHHPALPDHAEGRRRHAVGRHGSRLRGLERRPSAR